MKRVLILFTLLLICITPVSAMSFFDFMFGVCHDTDSGPTSSDPLPFIGIPGKADDASFGIFRTQFSKYDKCIDTQEREVESSPIIREVFCQNNKVTTKDFVCSDFGFTNCADTPNGAACVNLAATCGDGNKDLGEECDPAGDPCTTNGNPGTCNSMCQCEPNINTCGDGVKQVPEECDWGDLTIPENNCAPGFKCTPACECGPTVGICGDSILDPSAGEVCDPPGELCALALIPGTAGLSIILCDNNCKCPVPPMPPPPPPEADPENDPRQTPDPREPEAEDVGMCGNNVLEGNEMCDPPFSESCPPVLDLHGLCTVGICNDDCSCPVGEPCDVSSTLRDWHIVEQQRTIDGDEASELLYRTTPQQVEPRSCSELCYERDMSTSPVDHSPYILNELNRHSCVSGARVQSPGRTVLSGSGVEGGECVCYSRTPPSVIVNSAPAVCPAGSCGQSIACGESVTCSCGENCVLTESCSWNGWTQSGTSFIPSVGTSQQQEESPSLTIEPLPDVDGNDAVQNDVNDALPNDAIYQKTVVGDALKYVNK